MSGVTAANGITKMNKEGSYSSVKNDALIVMEMLEVHDKKGNVVDTYAVYFTDYPDSEKATGYMVVIKVAGIYNIEGFYAVPMAYILPTERKVVTCYDPQCINYLHDHTERDGYTPGKNPESEEEGEQPQQ